MRDRDDHQTEVEATLVVSATSPGAVLGRIRELDSLAGHPVRWTEARELRDVYVDTPARDLRDRGLALRLRRDGDGWRITLKGEGRPAGKGAVERMEVELDWSPVALERILGELEARGVRPGGVPAFGDGGDPVETLRSAGLEVIQDRRSRRRAGRLLEAGGDAETVGWLVLDRVRFPTGSGGRVRHREVEVEAAPGAPEGLASRLAAELRSRFPDTLLPWPHPKLATGLVLERIDPPASASGDLLPAAYDRLAERLGAG